MGITYSGLERRVGPDDAQLIADRSSITSSCDAYCYFDNDIKVKAPFDARRWIDKLGLGEG